MADPSPEQDEFKDHLRQYVWAGVPMAAVIILTKTLIARYPEVDVIWLFLAAAIPVVAVAYAFAFWWRSRRA